MRSRPGLRHTLAALALILAGCSDEPVTAPDLGGGWPGEEINDIPVNTMLYFERTYEYQVLHAYLSVLSADFRFEFSAESDPELILEFGSTWRMRRDSTSTAHLFDGFVTAGGDTVPGATSMRLDLDGVTIDADPDHADSTAHYQRVTVAMFALQFEVQGTNGYDITAPQEFRLVRGDAAAVRSDQIADDRRWYIRRWIDRSPAPAVRTPSTGAPATVSNAQVTTPGRLKATYLQ